MLSYFKQIKDNFKWKHYLNYLVLGTFFLVMILLGHFGILKRSTCYMFTQMAYAIILAVSLNFVVGFLGELSLGHAGFMCVGAYLGTYLSNLIFPFINNKVITLIICMLVGGIVAALFGFVVGLPALRLKGDYLAIVTLAFGEIVRNLCMNMPFFGGALGLKNEHTYGKDLYVVAFVTVIVLLIVIQNLVRSKHGRAITAVRDNEIAAKAMGINVTFYKLFAFTIAAFFAGVAGVIYGASTTPVEYGFFSYDYSIEILVMVVLGGIGSINGSILAAIFLTYVNITLMANLPGNLSALRFLIYALVLIVVILFNNAPVFKNLRERYSIARLRERIVAKRRSQIGASVDDEDSAEWDRVPTKIPMDELLSLDLAAKPDVADSHMPDEEGGAK